MKWSFLFLLIISSCGILKKTQNEPELPVGLAAAVDSSLRSSENVQRDQYVHPKETLKFFGIAKNLTVVEFNPGAGYFAEILAPYLAAHGQYVMAIPRLPPRPSAALIENEKKLQEILLSFNEVKAKSKFIPLEPLNRRNNVQKDSADMVLVFNSIHNWIASSEVKMGLKLAHDILKPGGVLGVVQHRIPEKKKKVPKSGYLYESEVITMITKAGFKLVEKSEINRNPRDTHDYPMGVWTLPPTYRLGDKERKRFEKIGESDKMTLKFIKI